MSAAADTVFLFDVDNTLFDNDRFQDDLRAELTRAHGESASQRYWTIFEELRGELGYADYLGALERLRIERLHDPTLLPTANWLLDYPFADRLFPHALKVVEHVRQWGRRSSCPTATPSFSRARSPAPACGTSSKGTC